MFLLVLLLNGANIPSAVHSDSLVENNSSFWENVSFGIGYEGGVCWTGEDLEPYSSSGFETIIPLYWSNSIKGSAYYPIHKGVEEFGVSIDLGGEYVRLSNRDNSLSNSYWDFRTVYGGISLNYNFIGVGVMGQFSWSKDVEKIYEDTDNNPYTPAEIVGNETYYGNGNGAGVFFQFQKGFKEWVMGVKFTFAEIRYTGNGPYYPINLDASGIRFFIKWQLK